MLANEKVFDQNFLEHHDGIYRLVYRIVRNAEEAEDLTQETFLRLYHHFDEVEQERVFHWLHRVAVNLALNSIRGKKRWFAWHQKATEESRLASKQSPRDPVESSFLRRVFGELSERQANLLVLHAAGFSYEELGKALDLKPSSMSQLLMRARRAFEKVYQSL